MRHSNRAKGLLRSSFLISASTAALMLPATAWAQTADHRRPPRPSTRRRRRPGRNCPDRQPAASFDRQQRAVDDDVGPPRPEHRHYRSRIRRTEATSAAPLQIIDPTLEPAAGPEHDRRDHSVVADRQRLDPDHVGDLDQLHHQRRSRLADHRPSRPRRLAHSGSSQRPARRARPEPAAESPHSTSTSFRPESSARSRSLKTARRRSTARTRSRAWSTS